MAITQEEREIIAKDIERCLVRAAGAVRNRIMIDGLNFDQACQHESVTYYTDLIEKNAAKLS